MIKVIVVSHGSYAKSLVESSELIMGKLEDVYTFGFTLGENVDGLRTKIEQQILEIQNGNDILILTDMKSGSPFNATASLMEKYSFLHIAGVNLPIFLEIIGTRDYSTVQELREMVMTIGKDSIVDVNKIMEE